MSAAGTRIAQDSNSSAASSGSRVTTVRWSNARSAAARCSSSPAASASTSAAPTHRAAIPASCCGTANRRRRGPTRCRCPGTPVPHLWTITTCCATAPTGYSSPRVGFPRNRETRPAAGVGTQAPRERTGSEVRVSAGGAGKRPGRQPRPDQVRAQDAAAVPCLGEGWQSHEVARLLSEWAMGTGQAGEQNENASNPDAKGYAGKIRTSSTIVPLPPG